MEEILVLKSHQRAAWLGVIVGILQEDEETTIATIKLLIAHSFANMIERGVVVEDALDAIVADACKTVLASEMAVQATQDILKEN